MTKTKLQYHIVLVTKYRKPVLSDEVLDKIKEVLYDRSPIHKIEIVSIGSDNKDHIHLVIRLNPTQKVSLIVQLIKQYTTYYVWKDFGPILRKTYWYKNHLWNDSYYCSTLGDVSKEVILEYVENHSN